MMIILTMLVYALIILARQQALVSRSAYDREAALFAMESAVAETQSRLEVDPTWEIDLVDQPMDLAPGAYTIRWNTTGSNLQPWESVNNMSNGAWAKSYRGDNTVPPYSALLVVTARVGTTERVGDFLLTRSGTVATSRPLLASGDIALQGNVRVDGIKSLATGSPVPAGVHSGTDAAGSGTIAWTPNTVDDRARVSGKVSTVNALPSAIDFGADPSLYFLGGEETGAAAQPVRKVNIPLTIAGKSTKPVLPAGTTAVAPGEWYYPGDLVVNGDLTLDGAALYVAGKLTVNGSISGRGSVYAGNDTTFQGDSSIESLDTNHVGLFSHGSVRLTGFEGTDYLDDMADPTSPNYDPEVEIWWAEAQTTLQDMQDLMDAYPSLAALQGAGEDATVLSMVQKLGESTPNVPPYGDPAGDIDVLGKIRDKVAARTPAGPTEAFLVDKLTALRDLYTMPTDPAAAIADYDANGNPAGLLYSVLATSDASHWSAATSLSHRTEFDKIGTSYFNGVVYTSAGMVAENEVNILGALIANKKGDGTTTFPDGVQVEWGDIDLQTGTRVTYVEDYFDKSLLSTPGAGYVKLECWLAR